MKVLLTSAGFENPKIQKVFLELVNKQPSQIKALFIPTAAINADAIAMLSKCMDDLLNCKIQKENIIIYDLHSKMSLGELNQFDAVYICGGSKEYLLKRINEQNFNIALTDYVKHEGVFVGVSAGSIIAAQNLPDNLGYINCKISVHCEMGTKAGEIDTAICPLIKLTDNQAILLTELNKGQIIE